MTTSPLQTQLGQQTANAAERIGETAEQAVRSARERVVPAAVRLASQAEDLALRGYDAVRESSQQLRERAADASERGVRYVKDEPVKAVLLAVAAGAAIMAIAQLLSSSRRDNG